MCKKIMSLLVVVAVLMCALFSSYAAAENTTEEYQSAVAEIMRNYKVDPDEAIAALAELDTVLLTEPEIVEYTDARSMARGSGVMPSKYTHTVYSFTRSGSNVQHLQWMIVANENEWSEGPLDYASLEWDIDYAQYYGSSGDGVMTTVQGKNTGIVLFNVEDTQLGKDDYTYGTVEVKPLKSGWLNFGSKFVHTYRNLKFEEATASCYYKNSAKLAEENIASLGLEKTYGYDVTISNSVEKWEIWADNSVRLS